MRLIAVLLAVLLLGGFAVSAVPPAWAAEPERYLCDGEPMLAEVHAGAVDAPGIPNISAGTAPGAFVVLSWRGLSLQLPRSNASGPPSYSDGKWFWSAADPEQPLFSLLVGAREQFPCSR
ncbi:hypothetical protein KQ304_13530 [Synechococcus sp. CS-1329]|jgi:hypothetical protein|uniref:hypothetical protein n=1 Tax=Synechococcus sp. CS-1329 TaxID=2847975 RepID=UPI00223C1401|nr:hypothetical protein [Synechococcus sp. CS-1329]MCT0219998.1 hypothetical protein [Synechococcus sp. CS-1329]